MGVEDLLAFGEILAVSVAAAYVSIPLVVGVEAKLSDWKGGSLYAYIRDLYKIENRMILRKKDPLKDTLYDLTPESNSTE